METRYSLVMLHRLIEFKRRNLKKRNLPCEVIYRLRVFSSCLLNFFYQKVAHTTVTAIHGNALRYGSGTLEMTELRFLDLLEYFLRRRSIVQIITTPPPNPPFLALLKQELELDPISSLRFTFTAHEILIIQYQRHGETILIKLGSGEPGQTYLQRQVASLKENKFLAAISSLGFECPQLLEEKQEDRCYMLLQKHIEGDVIRPSYPKEEELFQLFKIGVTTVLKINKALPCQPGKWDAYNRFDSLPAHYISHQQQLLVIIGYLNQWLTSGTIVPVYIHGDFHFGNIIFSKSHRQVVGVIDFDRASPGGTELHDSLTLLVSMMSKRFSAQDGYFGEVIIQLLRENYDDPFLAKCLAHLGQQTGYNLVDIKRMVLILWLFYLQSAMCESQQVSSVWLTKMLDKTTPQAYSFCQQHPLTFSHNL